MYEVIDAAHRGVDYRIRQIDRANWRWMVFPQTPGARRYGMSGSEAEAMLACFAAIDAMILEAPASAAA